MAKVSLTVEVSKEAHELAVGLSAIVKSIRQALADGWQVESDAPAIVLAALKELTPAVNGLDKLGAELVEDRAAFVKALGLGLGDVLDAALPKPAPVAAPSQGA